MAIVNTTIIKVVAKNKNEQIISNIVINITLLTFYEFIWFEENYNICNGFLSSLRNQAQYNY